MKVQILGTGSIYSKSNCAGILIDDSILVDVGPGIVKYILKNNIDLAKIDTIIFTHLHFDHIVDLPLFLVDSNVTHINHKINVYGPKGTDDKIRNLCRLLNNRKTDRYIKDYVNFFKIKDGSTITVHDHTFTAFEVIHGYIEAYGYVVDEKLGISGDCTMCENIKQTARDCSTMICDCSFETGDHNHMGIDNIIELKSLNEKLDIIPVHYRDATREKLRSMRLSKIHVIDDGYSFKI